MATSRDAGIVLFMGMVRRGEFESLARRGLPLGILVDTNSKARLGEVSGFQVVERFDFSRPLPELIETVRAIDRKVGVRCLFNVIEFYVAQTAAVAVALGLPGIPPSSARYCLDKTLMRERFRDQIGADAGARFHPVASERELLDQANRLGYPVFLQPTNVSASMWATRNENTEILLGNYRTMLDEVPRYYQKLGQKEKELGVVLAEYLEGANTSIDCVINPEGVVYTTPVVDVLTGRDIGIDDFHHFARILPTRLKREEERELARLAEAGCRALDMRSSAAHVEFIGRRLGEIGARPGGNRPRILELAYGIDELYAYYQALRGHVPDLRENRKGAAAIISPYPKKNGTLREIRYLDHVPHLPGYLYHEVRTPLGQPTGLAKGGNRAPLYIELCSLDPDEIRRGVDEVASWSDLYEVE